MSSIICFDWGALNLRQNSSGHFWISNWAPARCRLTDLIALARGPPPNCLNVFHRSRSKHALHSEGQMPRLDYVASTDVSSCERRSRVGGLVNQPAAITFSMAVSLSVKGGAKSSRTISDELTPGFQFVAGFQWRLVSGCSNSAVPWPLQDVTHVHTTRLIDF